MRDPRLRRSWNARPASPSSRPAASRYALRVNTSSGSRRSTAQPRAVPLMPVHWRSTRRLANGRAPCGQALLWTRTMPGSLQRSAHAWMACRWRSSWRRLDFGSSPRRRADRRAHGRRLPSRALRSSQPRSPLQRQNLRINSRSPAPPLETRSRRRRGPPTDT